MKIRATITFAGFTTEESANHFMQGIKYMFNDDPLFKNTGITVDGLHIGFRREDGDLV